MNEKGKAVVGYIFGWIGGLIILYGVKNNERNTKIHAAQSIVISGGYSILSLIYGIIPVTIPFFATALGLVYVIAIIFGIVKASKEENPELPVVGEFAKNIFGKKIDEVKQ